MEEDQESVMNGWNKSLQQEGESKRELRSEVSFTIDNSVLNIDFENQLEESTFELPPTLIWNESPALCKTPLNSSRALKASRFFLKLPVSSGNPSTNDLKELPNLGTPNTPSQSHPHTHRDHLQTTPLQHSVLTTSTREKLMALQKIDSNFISLFTQTAKESLHGELKQFQVHRAKYKLVQSDLELVLEVMMNFWKAVTSKSKEKQEFEKQVSNLSLLLDQKNYSQSKAAITAFIRRFNKCLSENGSLAFYTNMLDLVNAYISLQKNWMECSKVLQKLAEIEAESSNAGFEQLKAVSKELYYISTRKNKPVEKSEHVIHLEKIHDILFRQFNSREKKGKEPNRSMSLKTRAAIDAQNKALLETQNRALIDTQSKATIDTQSRGLTDNQRTPNFGAPNLMINYEEQMMTFRREITRLQLELDTSQKKNGELRILLEEEKNLTAKLCANNKSVTQQENMRVNFQTSCEKQPESQASSINQTEINLLRNQISELEEVRGKLQRQNEDLHYQVSMWKKEESKNEERRKQELKKIRNEYETEIEELKRVLEERRRELEAGKEELKKLREENSRMESECNRMKEERETELLRLEENLDRILMEKEKNYENLLIEKEEKYVVRVKQIEDELRTTLSAQFDQEILRALKAQEEEFNLFLADNNQNIFTHWEQVLLPEIKLKWIEEYRLQPIFSSSLIAQSCRHTASPQFQHIDEESNDSQTVNSESDNL